MGNFINKKNNKIYHSSLDTNILFENSLDTNISFENSLNLKGFQILCDKDGIILHVDDNILELLTYDLNEIVGKFIGILMSPFLSYIHSHIILPKYTKLNFVEKKVIDIFISGLKIKRPIIIFDSKSCPVYVNLSVKAFSSLSTYKFQVNFEPIKKIDNSLIYTHELYIKYKTTKFLATKNKIVVVSIDFRNSTEYLIKNGTFNAIELYKKFHCDVLKLLKKNYYPYIYIHEIIGDCFVIVSNIDWALSIPKFCASIIMSFLTELYKVSYNYIGIRVGISYDKIYWGYIDNNLRLFGVPMNISARLENVCVLNNISCDNNFLDKLKEEELFDTSTLEYSKKSTYLKGLGIYEYTSIPFDSITNLNIFNLSNIN